MAKAIGLFDCAHAVWPSAGRARTELLGGLQPGDKAEVVSLLQKTLQLFPIRFEMKDGVRRGLSCYVEEGFEAEVASLAHRSRWPAAGATEKALARSLSGTGV